MTLQRLNRTAPSHEALVRVYKSGKIVFNASAARLLELAPQALISVCFDKEAFDARGVKRLYVGTARTGYRVKPRRETYYVCSTSLCKDVADALEGYGTYRLCQEDFSRDADGTKYYNIFFKKYD
jgi:ferredoxin-NADP reductase